MVRFIVEVSEEYIRKHADPEYISSKIEQDGGKAGLGALVDMIGFGKLKHDMDESGATDYLISENQVDDKINNIFDHTVGNLAALSALIGDKLGSRDN